jgi:sec-independent protein translocase protein TatA
MGGLGLPELLVILVILLLVFGAARLPKLAKSIGEAGGELRKGFEGGIDKKPSTASKVETDKKV